MGKRQKAWARKARAALLILHGERCKRCGATTELEFDCVEPRGDTHHRMDSSARASFYRFQQQCGNLQLLCADCHSLKTALDTIAEQPTTNPLCTDNLPY